MAASSDQTSINVLLVPFPVQGHINPLLQFGKRLASHGGVRCTLAATRFVANSTRPTPSSVHVAVFSDGCDGGGPDEVGGMGAPYYERLESAGSATLDALLASESERGRPVHVVVYDAFLPWARAVAQRHGAAAAALFTQPCAVNVTYGHVWRRRVGVPADRGIVRLPGLPALEPEGLPWFLRVGPGPYPAYFELVMRQFQGLEEADDVLVNSVHELEPEGSCMLSSSVHPYRCLLPS